MVTMVTMVTMRMPTLTNRPRLTSVRTEASCCGNSGARDASAGRPAQMDYRDGPRGCAARPRRETERPLETHVACVVRNAANQQRMRICLCGVCGCG